MKPKRGTAWINLGLLLLAAALFLAAYNRNESYQAQRQSDVVLEEMSQALEQTVPAQTVPGQTEPPELPEAMEEPQREMPVRAMHGRDHIGVLTIPALELELPVLSQWDYTNLRIAPCRYEGSVYNGSLILCAHNYSSHFGRLKSLREGDVVQFTDMDDNVYTYQVVGLETLSPTDVEGMESGDWDLTLFTCTVGGQSRVTVRLERTDD